MVEGRTIWLSDYTAMNDVSEFQFARERLIALIQHRAVYMDTLPRICVSLALSNLSETTGLVIGSLSSRKDDLSQWRAYAENGQGCVVGIDARYLEQYAGVAIRSVVYDEQEVDRLLRAGLSVVQEQYDEHPEDVATLMDFARHLVVDLFTIKHPCFADEREVRISRMLVRSDAGQLEDVGGNRTDGATTPPLLVANRTGAFGETVYVALPLCRHDGTNAIVSVGFGPTMSADAVGKHMQRFQALGIDVWNSDLPYRA